MVSLGCTLRKSLGWENDTIQDRLPANTETAMNLSVIGASLFLAVTVGPAVAAWPMSNNPDFDASLEHPAYALSQGPVILPDGAHHNFFILTGYWHGDGLLEEDDWLAWNDYFEKSLSEALPESWW